MVILSASSLGATASKHEFQVNGVFSVATQESRDSLTLRYGLGSIDYAFTDYGGKYFYRGNFVDLGLSSGMYSSVASRSEVALSAPAASVVGTGATYLGGDYRLGLAWVPVQARGRFWLFRDLVYVELGAGPAYGFGAIQLKSTVQSAGVISTDTRYHKFSEWGLVTSLAAGLNLELVSNLALQVFVEGAHVYAQIRNPDLTQTGTSRWSQFFARPGLAIVFTF